MQRNFSRKISKFIAVAIVASSIFVNTTVVNAASIKDLSKSSAYAKEAIQWMANNNVISGDIQGNFSPQKTVSRAELVTLIVKALEIDTSNLPIKPTFSDVPTNHWAYKYVEAANKAGVVSGIGNGKFGVNNQCTREQITMMVLNYLSVSKEAVLADQGFSEIEKFRDESKMSDWAKASIQFAVSNKLMSGIGSDLFSPTGPATKEQIAVILYKFIISRDTIQQNADALKKPLITFNGDVLKLTEVPVIENGEILVPLEVFNKIGAKITADEQMNRITIKSSTIAGRNIYLKTGNQTAYVNYTGIGDPFNDSSAQDMLITLNNAPKKVGNEIFVPMKAVTDAIGLRADWNIKTNLIIIQDSAVQKNPILYNALKNTLEYNGEYSLSMDISMKELLSNEDFNILFSMKGAVNGLDSTSNSKFTIKIPGVPNEEYQYNIVSKGNKIYTKDEDTGEWSIISTEEAIDQGIMYFDVAADRAETQKLLDNYAKMDIVYAGKAILNGEEVSKYRIKLSPDIIEGLIPTDMLGGLGLNDIYNKGFDFNTEIYVNMQGQQVKQAIIVSGGVEQDGINIDILVKAYSEFINIGKDIEIVNPMQ